MKRDSLAFARGVVTLAAAVLLVLAIGTLADLVAAGYSPAKLAVFDYAEARFLADLTNRGSGSWWASHSCTLQRRSVKPAATPALALSRRDQRGAIFAGVRKCQR